MQVVNYPLAYFAERIGGEAIDLRFLPGDEPGDPAFWKPSAEDITDLQQADLLLLNGANYAKWLTYASLPASPQVDTSLAYAARLIPLKESFTHSHGKEGEHSHTGTAFTTWLDFDQARDQAVAVQEALIRLLPQQKRAFTQRAGQLLTDLGALDADMIGLRLGSTPLFGSHPVYQYLARRYALEILSFHFEPDTPLDPLEWASLEAAQADFPAAWMLWEDLPTEETVTELAKRGITSLVVRPCGNRPVSPEEDWLSVMQANVRQLQSIRP
ncbi:MAG: metal ABC transporter substrate-binding protein [Verrucomicrobiota bacterium]